MYDHLHGTSHRLPETVARPSMLIAGGKLRISWRLVLVGIALSGASAEESVYAQTAQTGSAAGALPPATVTAPEAAPRRVRRAEPSAGTNAARRAQRSPAARPSSQQRSSPALSAGATPGRGGVSSAVTALPAAGAVVAARSVRPHSPEAGAEV
jgi:hypothetical protein